MGYFDQFIAGFVEHGRLTPQEIACVPDLINLRILSNVVSSVVLMRLMRARVSVSD